MKVTKTMTQAILRIFPTAVLALWSLVSYGLSIKDDSVRFEVLLTNKMFSNINLNEKFVTSVDITSNRLILLSSSNRFYVLGWGGIDPVGQKIGDAISSFAYTPDGFLMIVRNKELCFMDSVGNVSRLFGLPSKDMGISAGKFVMYFYDRQNSNARYSLYVIARGGKYARLFEVPAPISSVAEVNDNVLFASGSSLFSYDLKNKKMKALIALKKDMQIKSLTTNTSGNTIYFSTGNAIYSLKDSCMLTITNDFGGVLKYYDNGLIVFNPEKKLVMRIVGLEAELKTKVLASKTAVIKKNRTEMLTNESIINLVKADLSDDLILKIINKSDVNFDVSVDAMIILSDQKVSSALIVAMKTAMRKKAENGSSSSN
jgi:hypothetical protein